MRKIQIGYLVLVDGESFIGISDNGNYDLVHEGERAKIFHTEIDVNYAKQEVSKIKEFGNKSGRKFEVASVFVEVG